MIRSILLDILGPILLLVLLGALVRRKFKSDVGTLSKLNIYVFVPAFLFDQVSRSTLKWSDMGGVVIITVLQVLVLGLLIWGGGVLLRVNRKTLAAVAISVMFYNSGNFGLPLAELAFPAQSDGATERRSDEGMGSKGTEARRHEGTEGQFNPQSAIRNPQSAAPSTHKDGAAVQAFVVFCQNLLTFTVGLMIAAWAGGGSMKGSLRALLRMPTLYTIAAALLAKWWHDDGHELPKVITATTGFLAKGLIPIALITLGAQLAVAPRWPRWKPVSAVLALRLIFGPIQMGLLLWGLHLLSGPAGMPALSLWPWPAEALILTAAVPTAVNTLLITLEVGGDAELSADCVFWTTVMSALTITGWLVLLRAAPWFQ